MVGLAANTLFALWWLDIGYSARGDIALWRNCHGAFQAAHTFSDFRAGIRPGIPRERSHIVAGQSSRTVVDALVAGEEVDTERRQCRAGTARRGRHHRFSESSIDRKAASASGP